MCVLKHRMDFLIVLLYFLSIFFSKTSSKIQAVMAVPETTAQIARNLTSPVHKERSNQRKNLFILTPSPAHKHIRHVCCCDGHVKRKRFLRDFLLAFFYLQAIKFTCASTISKDEKKGHNNKCIKYPTSSSKKKNRYRENVNSTPQPELKRELKK